MAYQLIAGTGAFTVSLVTKPKRIASWGLATTSAAAGVILFRDGSASGPIVFRINLAGNSSASQAYKRPYLVFPAGVFVDCTAGVITGSVDLV